MFQNSDHAYNFTLQINVMYEVSLTEIKTKNVIISSMVNAEKKWKRKTAHLMHKVEQKALI